jgi:hypothetical protein
MEPNKTADEGQHDARTESCKIGMLRDNSSPTYYYLQYSVTDRIIINRQLYYCYHVTLFITVYLLRLHFLLTTRLVPSRFLPGCDAVYSCDRIQTFRRIFLPPSWYPTATVYGVTTHKP